MDWVETTGKSVEEAKRAALEQLGVEEADADFEVVAEPKLGLFGRLREEARVRARVQPKYPRAKADRRERRRSRSHSEHAAEGEGGTEQVADDGAAAPASSGGRGRGADRERPSAEPRALGEAHPGEAAANGRRKRRPAAANRGNDSGDAAANFGEVSAEALEEQAKLAESFIRGLLDQLGASATVTINPVNEGMVQVDVQGEDLGVLIGPKGATLAALQELTRTVLQRQNSAPEGRVVIDVNGYRKRRQEALARFVQQVAGQVISSGQKRALEPMPAPDRKVVHDTANSIEGVRTVSEGEEPYRRVVLVPDKPAAGDEVEAASQTA